MAVDLSICHEILLRLARFIAIIRHGRASIIRLIIGLEPVRIVIETFFFK